jgi:hypothetical protein
MNGGIMDSVTGLHLVGYFYKVYLCPKYEVLMAVTVKITVF